MAEAICRGVVRDGMVLLDKGSDLPEGTDVLVTPFGSRKGGSRDILDVLNASPHVSHEDVEELLRLIREGKRPARYGSPFVRNRTKRAQ
ncbi:MAG: hypothetical protein FJ291_17080 [Planctomycetes bacterium]|nr:hypothetical protein [Planctomycetota bacterium]